MIPQGFDADMYYAAVGDRVRFFKESEERITILGHTKEDMRNQTLKEDRTV